MKKKNNGNRDHILWRYTLIVLAIAIFAGCISFRLFSTTVLHYKDWNERAKDELSKIKQVKPERGDILADDGSILATNLIYYTIRIDYLSEKFDEELLNKNLPALTDSLAKHFPKRTKKEWNDYLTNPYGLIKEYKKLSAKFEKNKSDSILEKKVKRLKGRLHSWLIARNITFDQKEMVKNFPYFVEDKKNPRVSGIVVETVKRRSNPYGDMAQLSIGIVGEIGKTREVHGVWGLEKALDSLLYGKPGESKKVSVTKGYTDWNIIDPVPGYDVHTTINVSLQDIVEDELNKMLEAKEADWGLAVLMEVKTGDIKAISNLEVDSIALSKGQRRYIEGQNRAILGYEPGSVVKTLSMLVALEDGLIPDTSYNITTGARWPYGDIAVKGHASEPSVRVSNVLRNSSNIGISKILTGKYNGGSSKYDKNPAAYPERLKQMGFLEKMNIGIAGERAPRFRRKPSRYDLACMSFGYASMIPPVSTLALYNAIANDGKYVRPRLYSRLTNEYKDSIIPVSYIRDSICSVKNAKILQAMLKKVVWDRKKNTAYGQLQDENVAIAGKTGTAELIDTVTKTYRKGHNRTAFCGYFPADDPQYTCIVVICDPRIKPNGSPTTSGMTVKNIALKMYSRGILGNSSDYTEKTNPGTQPTFHAGVNNSNAKAGFDLGQVKQFRTPNTSSVPSGTVPSVIGFGARAAIAALEGRGYNVSITGSGHVVTQNPPAGTKLKPGQKINLTLKAI